MQEPEEEEARDEDEDSPHTLDLGEDVGFPWDDDEHDEHDDDDDDDEVPRSATAQKHQYPWAKKEEVSTYAKHGHSGEHQMNSHFHSSFVKASQQHVNTFYKVGDNPPSAT